MKITDVQACVIGEQVPHSGGSVWTFVRIYTDEGIVGTGECNSGGPGASGFATKAAIMAMRKRIIGEDPFNVNLIYEKLRRGGRYGGSSNAPIIFALTGIDNALYDICGKALGIPVYKLLGGKFRDKIRLYADCHAGEEESVQAYAEKALERVEQGFSAVKFDVDSTGVGKLDPYNWTVGAKEMTHIISLIAGLREAVGFEVDLAIDCHGQFDLPSAITLAKAVEPLRLLWLEEPVPAENVAALAQVKATSSTVICSGENQYTRFEFMELFSARAVDVIMPDLAKAGGIAEAKRIADLADAHYIPIAPHNVSTPHGMMAAAHVMASVPNFLVLELHALEIPWWSDLCDGDKPFFKDGFMTVSERPGIGVELNDAVARKLLWNGDTYFD
ncbi:MAG: mandelate racemase/muconate lactonizing enzyme family protein [Anaerolineae bacterium]|nr:mandelate racemase/muconate lactonizing enzyme family protein [Anaerolineae bacterium]NUQ03696.1 mandelate racemase/muconate lactonizing enzyme family protein [Anaerolineae bacterium]